MAVESKKLFKFFIRILITTGLLVWVFGKIDTEQFKQSIVSANWEFLIMFCVIVIAFFRLQAVKMRFILKKQNCNVDTATIFRASAITALYSMTMPGMMSTGVKWYILKKDTGKGTNVFSGMVYNQFAEIVTATVFGLGAIIITNPTSLLLPETDKRYILPIVCSVSLAAIVIISVLLLNPNVGGKLIKALQFLLKPAPEKIRHKGSLALEQFTQFQTAPVSFHLRIVAMNIGIVVCGTCALYVLAAKAANINVSVGVLIWLGSIVYILGRIPISIGNLGVREVTLAGVLSIYGIQTPQALLMSMILFSALVLMAIIGAIYQISWSIRSKEEVPADN